MSIRTISQTIARSILFLSLSFIIINGTILAGNDFNTAWLITPEEAAMAPAPEISGDSPFNIGSDELSLGPLIEVISPKDGEQVSPPIEVNIKFTPQGDPIDLKSLEVSVVKLFSIDITDRVKDYTTAAGIHVKEAKLPTGKHTVKISLADTKGMYSKKIITFEIL